MAYKNPADQAAAARRHYEANKEKMKARAIAHKAKVRAQIREHVIRVKSVPCMDCRVDYPWYIMEFDHVRGEKLFNIAEAATRGKTLKKTLEEIDKCEVVCANCHRARTWERRLKKQ